MTELSGDSQQNIGVKSSGSLNCDDGSGDVPLLQADYAGVGSFKGDCVNGSNGSITYTVTFSDGTKDTVELDTGGLLDPDGQAQGGAEVDLTGEVTAGPDEGDIASGYIAASATNPSACTTSAGVLADSGDLTLEINPLL